MTVYVFTGPTLSPAEAGAALDAVYLPPVAQGDVYRVALKRPQAIGIIDGYFERVPSVWHKEILWALAQGIPVFGSASMGALRAAELSAFGMEGVGTIFAAYRDGVLEDDDEVAVLHGPAESGYRALSVAMVNIRQTLAAAEAAAVVGPDTRQMLEQLAKACFYPERNYAALLQQASAQGLPPEELHALRAWLPQGQIDQKREDALAMLREIRNRLAAGLAPQRVDFHFEHTEFWDRAQSVSGELFLDSGAETLFLDSLLDEVRLIPGAYEQARQTVLARTLAVAEAQRRGQEVTDETLRTTMVKFRHEHDLVKGQAMSQWLAEQDFTQEQFRQLLEQEALRQWAVRWADHQVLTGLLDQLRLLNMYTRLKTRARDKQHLLDTRGQKDLSLATAGLTQEELLRWYFIERLGWRAVPDIGRYAQQAGFADPQMLVYALLREWFYLRT
jgi:hypothetical protein